MSAEPMIRELFSAFKTTVSERLDLIVQVLNTIEKPKVSLYDNEFIKRIERLEQQQTQQRGVSHDLLEERLYSLEHQQNSRFVEERITALEEQLAATCAELEELRRTSRVAPVTAPTASHTAPPSHAASHTASHAHAASHTASHAHAAPPSPIATSEDDILPDADADVECEVLEEEEVEEEVEDDGVELEPFTHKGTVYYKDAENNVYMVDEDGALGDEPVARWNGVSGSGSKLLRLQ